MARRRPTPAGPRAAAGVAARPGAKGSGRRNLLKFLALVLLVAGSWAALRWTPLRTLVSRGEVLALLESVRGADWAGAAFVLVYAGATALALPGSVLTLAGGALFGLWPGVPFNLAGATIGSVLAFLLARFLGRDFVAARLGGRAAALDRAAGRHGFRAILLLRLVPLVPFNALNYGAGLSGVRFRDYVLGSAVGMLPGTFAYTYFADALLAGSVEAREDAYVHIAVAGGLLVLLSFLPLAWRRWRGAASGGGVQVGRR
ncbi:MAG: TVP38/TMEM64 family protein [Gemmatimonadetes bacterium]|nr:TVP38/TMEM64 family protein [Gemmatimonadota bacterium]